MLEEYIKKIVKETVTLTLQELSTLEQKNENIPNFLTVKQAAKYLCMSESWIYKNYRKLPYKKIGRNIRFIKFDLEHWREEQKESKQQVNKTTVSKKKSNIYRIS